MVRFRLWPPFWGNFSVNALDAVLIARDLTKLVREGEQEAFVVHGVDLTIYRGEMVALVGPSGAGKSTLLHLLSTLDLPSSGEIWLSGVNLATLDAATRDRMRNRVIGFIYQFHHLLSEFSALENVALPLLIRGESIRSARDLATEMLGKVGLLKRMEHLPAELSGGERQRVAIARALVTKPQVLFADEPTGNLDQQNAEQVFALLSKLKNELGTAMVIATHDPALMVKTDRVVRLVDGRIVSN